MPAKFILQKYNFFNKKRYVKFFEGLCKGFVVQYGEMTKSSG